MAMKYTDEMGKAVAVRGKFQIFKERELHAIYYVSKELAFDENDNIIDGERDEAYFVGYVADISDINYAFDLAEEQMRAELKALEADLV